VRDALASLPWVRQAKVDFPKQQASVTVVADKYDHKVLIKTLEKEGFQAKVLKESGGSRDHNADGSGRSG